MDWRTCGKRVIGGLDHLGVATFSIALYGKLLPGVTNVTDRARYYSFYPWVIHAYAAHARTDDRNKWLTWFRRLDFAYAMASIAADMRDQGDARAVVGASLARKTLQDTTDASEVDFKAADLTASGKVPKEAYFKRAEGGLGQYYKAVLRELGVFVEDEDLSYPDIKLSMYAGKPLADSVEQQPAFTRLAEIAQAGTANVGELAEIGSAIGPSAIVPDTPEHLQLCGLFWGEDDALCKRQAPASRECRRNTLLALLAFVEATSPPASDAVDLFRVASAEHRLIPAKWTSKRPGIASFLHGWADYQWNEYVNYALEALLWAVVQLVREQPTHTSALASTLTDLALSAASNNKSDVKAFINNCLTIQDAHGNEPAILSAAYLKQAIRQSILSEDLGSTVRSAVKLLGHVISATDHASDNLFQSIPDAQQLILSHRIHLPAWRRRVQESRDQAIKPFLEQLFADWVINRHLFVPTRKLASQGVQTYKFAPEDGVLVCLTAEDMHPGPTNPRLRQGLQMLQDLDFIKEDNGQLSVTNRGKAKLQESA